MKINFFAVNNFRGISGGLENNKIIFADTNTLFIFGQNNVGKSTFLKAYEAFFKDFQPTPDDFFNRDEKNNIEFEIEVQMDEYDIERIEEAAPKQKDSLKKYLNNNVLRLKNTWILKPSKSKETKIAQTFNPTTQQYDAIGYGSVGLHNVFQSCMPKPIFIKAMPSEAEVNSILNEILKNMAESALKKEELEELINARQTIKNLQDKMYKPETIELYQKSVNEYFSKIFKDTALEFKERKDRVVWTENKLGKDFDIEFSKIGSDGTNDIRIPSTVNNIGHGTIRTAIFTLLLMKDVAEQYPREVGRKDYMVLFEEPELFLYPKIIKELRELIYQVSTENLPYQVLCASHSPSMIDLSKPKSSIIRLITENGKTKIFQINDSFLKQTMHLKTDQELKQEMYEVLRFNPFLCEAFYADEVILIEGPTEEIIIRAYLQEHTIDKNIFVLNCGTVTNIPFYQKIFSKFNIKYHVICDTDDVTIESTDSKNNPSFDKGIQKSISDQFKSDTVSMNGNMGLLRVHHTTFEPAHQLNTIPKELQFQASSGLGKPYDANLYWKEKLYLNLNHLKINEVPIMKYMSEIIKN